MDERATARRASPTWAGGRTRRAAQGRHRVVGVRVTDYELTELRRRATGAGVSPPRYLLEAALSSGAVTVADRRRRIAEFAAMRGELARLGSTLRQVAQVAIATGSVPVEVAGAMAGVRRVAHRLEGAIDRLVASVEGPGR